MIKIFNRAGALLMAALFVFLAVFAVAPVQVSAAEEYTVSGVWVFNDGISLPSEAITVSDLQITFPDSGNASTYTSFSVTLSMISCSYRADDGQHGLTIWHKAWANSGWADNSTYKTISFGESEQSVSAEFFSWFTANATFQETPLDPGPLVGVITVLKEQNQLTQVLTGVVQMIPIGLAFWVGYKGFLKALALLLEMLHKA